MATTRRAAAGFSYVELLIAVSIAGLLMAGMDGVIGVTARAMTQVRATTSRHAVAQAALEEMRRAVAGAGRLLVPLADDPGTAGSAENRREQTVGTFGVSAVMVVTLDPRIDRDGDGFPDADNDRDGRIDEDWPADNNNDARNGARGLDDRGNLLVDTPLLTNADDDESGGLLFGAVDEDPLDGIDNDGDGAIDEDTGADMNGDGAPGVAGIDDDGDGSVDEGDPADDDEDGVVDEDWLDTVAFYLNGSNLVQRTPVPWDVDGSGTVTGRDYVESVLAEEVSYFAIERVAPAPGGQVLVRLTLRLAGALGEAVEVAASVRVGGHP
ncbi:MAG: type II secretion system protein [Gammaproteobacteria bacterium]